MNAFNKKKIDLIDIILIVIYLIVTIAINFDIFFKTIESYRNFILLYTFLTPFYIYLISYKSLRNIYISIIWILFGLYHHYLYSILIKNEAFTMVRGHSANGLQYTIIFIIIFQVFRISHLFLFKRELIGLPMPGRTKDPFDNKIAQGSDIILFVIYNVGWIALMMNIR